MNLPDTNVPENSMTPQIKVSAVDMKYSESTVSNPWTKETLNIPSGSNSANTLGIGIKAPAMRTPMSSSSSVNTDVTTSAILNQIENLEDKFNSSVLSDIDPNIFSDNSSSGSSTPTDRTVTSPKLSSINISDNNNT